MLKRAYAAAIVAAGLIVATPVAALAVGPRVK